MRVHIDLDVGGGRNRFAFAATSMEAEPTFRYFCHLTILPIFRDTEDAGHVGHYIQENAAGAKATLPS